MSRGLALLPALALAWPGWAAEPPAPAPDRAGFIGRVPDPAPPGLLTEAVQGLQTGPLARHLAYLTAPERQGRGLGTRGLAATGSYLAAHLGRLGLPPLKQSYFQSVPLREISRLGGTLRLTWPGHTLSWQHGVNCLLPELEPQLLDAPLVFAGYGIQETSLGHDDFQGLDVKGKIVLLVGGLPPLPAWQRPELVAKYGSVKPQDRYEARLEALDRLGAKAVLAIEPGLAAELAAPRPLPRPFFRPAPGVPFTDQPPLIRLTALEAAPLLAALGVELARPETVRPQVPAQARAELKTTGTVRNASSRNVLAVLKGTDPAAPAVLIGAHMDHLGMAGGVLHPGADDNASGVSALAEIARAFAKLPVRPRRTVIFAFWTGEEDGKFGSGHYVRHPQWPLAKTSAYLNLDMIGHPWTAAELRKLVVDADPAGAEAFLAGLDPAAFAEPGFAETAPELGPILARAGRLTGMALHLDPTDGRSGGSDYREFARVNVPWVRFFGNFFPAYHEPGDTAADLDPSQVQRMARLAFATAWLLADGH